MKIFSFVKNQRCLVVEQGSFSAAIYLLAQNNGFFPLTKPAIFILIPLFT